MDRSFFVSSATAIVVSLACVTGTFCVTSIAQALALSADARLQKAMRGAIADGSRTWDPQSIRNVDIESVAIAVGVLDSDRPEYSAQILPHGIGFQQFDRMINREISRRGMWAHVYESFSRSSAGLPYVESTTARKATDFARASFVYPQGISSENKLVRLNPTLVALYDSALDTLIDNRSGFAYSAETARAAGLPKRSNGLAYGIDNTTDVADKRRLYALGAQSAFNPNNPNAQITVTVNIQNSLENIQNTYCALMPGIYKSGRAQQPSDIGILGLLESRVDARNGFEPRDANFGITGPCPA